MFKINKINTNKDTFWIEMMDTNTKIIFTKIENIIDFRIFNKETIYNVDINIDNFEEYRGELSEDGNEYFIKIGKIIINLYYSLNNNLVVSSVEKKELKELITIPEVLLN